MGATTTEVESEFTKKIKQLIKKTGGEDSNLLDPLKFHLTVLRDSNSADEIETRLELCQYLLSKMFIDTIESYPNKPFKCKIDDYSDWPMPPRPSELFGRKKQDLDLELHRSLWSRYFYKTLEIGNVLDCRVVEILPLQGHTLRVLHKHGDIRILENLHIEPYLKTDKNEMEVLGSELLPNELVRVAVHNIKQVLDVYTVFVTVDIKKLPVAVNFRPMPKLGRISKEDMPDYVFESPDAETYTYYSQYLLSEPNFRNTEFYSYLIEGYGMDPKAICSYFSNFSCEPAESKIMRECSAKDSKLSAAKLAAKDALKYLQEQKYDDAIKEIKNALKVCPSDDLLMSKLYDIRSEIYSVKVKKDYNVKSLCDLETAFRFPTCDADIKKKFLKKVFKIANCYLREKNYKKAVIGFEYIIKYDENNPLAAKALDHIKTKHADKLLNLEEMSQIDLQEKKKELLTELKKMKVL